MKITLEERYFERKLHSKQASRQVWTNLTILYVQKKKIHYALEKNKTSCFPKLKLNNLLHQVNNSTLVFTWITFLRKRFQKKGKFLTYQEERRGGSGCYRCWYSTEACTTPIPTTATSWARGHSTFRQGSKKYTSSLNSEEHQHIQLLLIRQKEKWWDSGRELGWGEENYMVQLRGQNL